MGRRRSLADDVYDGPDGARRRNRTKATAVRVRQLDPDELLAYQGQNAGEVYAMRKTDKGSVQVRKLRRGKPSMFGPRHDHARLA